MIYRAIRQMLCARGCLLTLTALTLACTPPANWRPRVVLLYLDLSASVPPSALNVVMVRVATELHGGDRLAVYAITANTGGDAVPVLDTVVPGTAIDRLSEVLGLSTRHSRRLAQDRAEMLSRVLLVARERATARLGRAKSSSIIEAVCHAGLAARSGGGSPTFAILATDGIEESALANLALSVPNPQAARHLAERVRLTDDCDLSAPTLTLRITSLRHATSTTALRLWWRSMLAGLGYQPGPDDVATHTLSGLLSLSEHRSPATAGR